MFFTLDINTSSRVEFIEITKQLENIVKKENIGDGICTVYVPHTTAALTINENADPTVVEDMINHLNKKIPFQDGYKHFEGNSAAHIKASFLGSSENIIINKGKLVLGTWQGIYFAEFDGPRSRKAYIKIL